MCDLCVPKYFLGLEIACSRARILICQRKYALELPTDAGYLGCRSISVPMEQSVKPSELDGDSLEDPAPYRRIIGQLIYLNITRPDLSYSVNILSQYMSVPRTTHCGAALRVLRYIKGCLGQGLFREQKQRCGLKAFADFDWASCLTLGDGSADTAYYWVHFCCLGNPRSKVWSHVPLQKPNTMQWHRLLARLYGHEVCHFV